MDAKESTIFPHWAVIVSMSQCAMKRLSILPVLLLPFLSMAATPQEIISKQYKEFNKNILKSDARAMTAWLQRNCASKFTYTSYQKKKFNRDGYLSGILQQIAKTSQVLKSTTTIRSFEKLNGTIVATVASDFNGIVAFDSRRLIITDQSVTLETWTPVGKEWKLKKVVQVNADTQMHQEGGD